MPIGSVWVDLDKRENGRRRVRVVAIEAERVVYVDAAYAKARHRSRGDRFVVAFQRVDSLDPASRPESGRGETWMDREIQNASAAGRKQGVEQFAGPRPPSPGAEIPEPAIEPAVQDFDVLRLRAASASPESFDIPGLLADTAGLVAALRRRAEAKCAQPGAASCAREWERDHQRAAVVEAGLGEEFTASCDAIQDVVEALVAARLELAALRRRAEEAEAMIRKIGHAAVQAGRWPYEVPLWQELAALTAKLEEK